MEIPPPPNLSDPAERAAYRRELRGVAKGVRGGGLAILFAGLVLSALRAWVWPGLSALVPLVVVAWGVLLMLTAIALRMAYHARRMRGG